MKHGYRKSKAQKSEFCIECDNLILKGTTRVCLKKDKLFCFHPACFKIYMAPIVNPALEELSA